jgi:hypothetical protein
MLVEREKHDGTIVESHEPGTCKLLTGAGRGDRIYVARDKDVLRKPKFDVVYVMSYSVGMDYIGVTMFDLQKMELVKGADQPVFGGEDIIWLDGASEALEGHVRKPWSQYTEGNLLRLLLNLYG